MQRKLSKCKSTHTWSFIYHHAHLLWYFLWHHWVHLNLVNLTIRGIAFIFHIQLTISPWPPLPARYPYLPLPLYLAPPVCALNFPDSSPTLFLTIFRGKYCLEELYQWHSTVLSCCQTVQTWGFIPWDTWTPSFTNSSLWSTTCLPSFISPPSNGPSISTNRRINSALWMDESDAKIALACWR